jgi:hypothetical protein
MTSPPHKPRGPLLWLAGRSRRFWIVGLLIGLPVGYVAIFGPACWAVGRRALPVETTALFYDPLLRLTLWPPGRDKSWNGTRIRWELSAWLLWYGELYAAGYPDDPADPHSGLEILIDPEPNKLVLLRTARGL